MAEKPQKRGRPIQGSSRKISITIRMEPEVLDRLRSTAMEHSIPYQSHIQNLLKTSITPTKKTLSPPISNRELFMALAAHEEISTTSFSDGKGGVVLGGGNKRLIEIIKNLKVFISQIREKNATENRASRTDNSQVLQSLKNIRKDGTRLIKNVKAYRTQLLSIKDLRARIVDDALKELEIAISHTELAEGQVKALSVIGNVAKDLVTLFDVQSENLTIKAHAKLLTDASIQLFNEDKNFESMRENQDLIEYERETMVDCFAVAIKKLRSKKYLKPPN